MQFHFLTVGVKWKVVKNVHCPPVLIDTSSENYEKKAVKHDQLCPFGG